MPAKANRSSKRASAGIDLNTPKRPRKEQLAADGDLPLSRLRSLSLVPAEIISDVFLCLPFTSMQVLGLVYGATDDAAWRRLLGDSLCYVWAEAMIRDLDAVDVATYVRGIVDRFAVGRPVSLPRQCPSLVELYRIVVTEMTYLRRLDSARSEARAAMVVLAVATQGSHELRSFTLPESVR